MGPKVHPCLCLVSALTLLMLPVLILLPTELVYLGSRMQSTGVVKRSINAGFTQTDRDLLNIDTCPEIASKFDLITKKFHESCSTTSSKDIKNLMSLLSAVEETVSEWQDTRNRELVRQISNVIRTIKENKTKAWNLKDSYVLDYLRRSLHVKGDRLVIRRNGEVLLINESVQSSAPAWRKFHSSITHLELYQEENPAIADLLHDLTTQPIVEIDELMKGTQLKLIVTFANGGKGLLKPGRFSRDYETSPDHYYFHDFERHTAEIAAFHLDRVLGFRRVPPVAGRIVNMTHDITRLAKKPFLKTIYRSPANNICMFGTCSQYCSSRFPVCGKPELIEASISAFLPERNMAHTITHKNPWQRSYNLHMKAMWETDPNYCNYVKETPPYDQGRRLLDLMDLSIYDFLTGNLDRHNYRTFEIFDNYSTVLHLDQGRSFGKSKYDELSALVPVQQCCVFRHSTLYTLIQLASPAHKLSRVMRESLKHDKLKQVLTEPHLKALDRRVMIVLRTAYDCLQKNKFDKVVIDDQL